MARVARRRIVSATGYGDLISSFVLVVPLLLAYDLGVLLSSTINGADFITRGMLALCGHQRLPYLVMHSSIAIVFLMWLYRSGRQRTWSIDVALPMIVEAAVYALTLGAAVSLVDNEEMGYLKDIERLIKRSIARVVVEDFVMPETAASHVGMDDEDRRPPRPAGGRNPPNRSTPRRADAPRKPSAPGGGKPARGGAPVRHGARPSAALLGTKKGS